MRKFILPTSISDMQALFIDMNNRIEELEAIERERNENWKETSKLIRNLK